MANKYELFVHYGPYDKETIEAMYSVRFAGMPLSFLLLDGRKTDTYCHFCASLLALTIPGAKRVEGKQVVIDGSEHSWVEVDDVVYDTSKLSMWQKDAYYDRYGVLSADVVSDEDVHKQADTYLNDEGYVEAQVAWIQELEENVDTMMYKTFLVDHIARFKEEIGYDSLKPDMEVVGEVRQSIDALYGEIKQFISDNPVLYKD